MNISLGAMSLNFKRTILLLVSLQAICACGKDAVPVNIHGVNYDKSAFSYVMSDPADKENRAGGELIEPFSAGGIMCCFMLPRKWYPGLKVSVKWTYWLSKPGSKNLEEVKKTELLDIPSYPTGKPAELWVLRNRTGSLTLVSSNLQPDHPAWPGQVKGWPTPSLEFMRERWELHVQLAQGNVDLFQHLLQRLHDDPSGTAKEVWASSVENSPYNIKGFSGPTDPRYLTALEVEFRESLAQSKAVLEQQIRSRP